MHGESLQLTSFGALALLLRGARLIKDQKARSVACNDGQNHVAVHGHHAKHHHHVQKTVEEGVEERYDNFFSELFLGSEPNGLSLKRLQIAGLFVELVDGGVRVLREEDLLEFALDCGHGHGEEGENHGDEAADDEGDLGRGLPAA